jgi:hypothetical protein
MAPPRVVVGEPGSLPIPICALRIPTKYSLVQSEVSKPRPVGVRGFVPWLRVRPRAGMWPRLNMAQKADR